MMFLPQWQTVTQKSGKLYRLERPCMDIWHLIGADRVQFEFPQADYNLYNPYYGDPGLETSGRAGHDHRPGRIGRVPHARADQAPAASADTPEEAAVAPIRLVPVTGGLDTPLFLTSARDGSGRLFALERSGRVRIVEGGKLVARPFLDLSGRVLAGGEQGLLGLAFHPGYRTNGRFFVDYTRKPDGATVVAEYHVSSDPDVALSAGRTVLIVPQPFANHNGGALAFGPDGRLYIGLGDGGSEGDPGNRAQDRDVLLGKVLRIDVDGGQALRDPARQPVRRPPAAGTRSTRSASATRGGSRSTAGRACSTPATSGRAGRRRSTSSGGAATTAGGLWRGTCASRRRAGASGRA